MDCFAHADVPAVGLCKVCARGVCRGCAIEVTNGLACCPDHRALAEQLAQTQIVSARNTGFYRAQRLVQSVTSAAVLLIGGAFAWHNPRDPMGWSFLAAGVMMATVTVIATTRRR